jgi:hypothetical protein
MRTMPSGCIAVLIAVAGFLFAGALDQQTRDALNVSHILKQISQAPPAADGALRSVTISEQELDAYIAWRLAREPDSGVRSLDLHLLDNDHIAGTIRFDAARLSLDALLGDSLDFDFKGILFSRGRAARLELISLSLCGYPVKPQVLDYVLEAAARHQGTESGGLDDWYALPAGVQRITVTTGAAVLYY